MMALTWMILMLCAGVALTSACCTPDQWEGIQASIGGYSDRRRSGIVKEYVAVAYDASNNRTAAFVDYSNGEHSNKFKLVTRYEGEEGKLYVVDLKKGKCWTKTLDRPFRKSCIPDDAKSVGDYYMGLDGGFKVTGYEFKGERISAFISVEKLDNDQCVPVSEAVYGKLNKVGFVSSVGFIDIKPGIRNETVFDVPKECEKREVFSLAEELTREHYIMAI